MGADCESDSSISNGGGSDDCAERRRGKYGDDGEPGLVAEVGEGSAERNEAKDGPLWNEGSVTSARGTGRSRRSPSLLSWLEFHRSSWLVRMARRKPGSEAVLRTSFRGAGFALALALALDDAEFDVVGTSGLLRGRGGGDGLERRGGREVCWTAGQDDVDAIHGRDARAGWSTKYSATSSSVDSKTPNACA